MIQSRIEPAKSVEPAPATKPAQKNEPRRQNGWGALLANMILMPALSYGITVFILIPKLEASKSALESPGVVGANLSKAKPRSAVPLGGKILVNVAGTGGTRYLVANMSLVGKTADLKTRIEEADSQLRDAAMNVLSGKTISDLEKPGGRNLIRTELIASFNTIIGKETVTDIYFTEFAIQ
jgi:flagellar protein FliL